MGVYEAAENLEIIVQVVRQNLVEGEPVLVVNEAVVEDPGGLVSEQLGAVVLAHYHRVVGLQQSLDHLQ